MLDTEKKVLEGFLSKTLKIDTEELAGLYNEAGELISLNIASEADASRIKKLKEDAASQYKRGIKEGASKIENDLKEKYDVDSDLTGIELLDFVITEKTSKDTDQDEDITKHPEYLRLKLETDKQLRAKDKEWQKKFDDKEGEYSKKAIMARVKDKALAELENLKPILPEDAKKAQRWKQKFLEELSTFEYNEQDGTFVVLKDGKPFTDSHGYTTAFEEHVKNMATEMFEFHTSEPRSASGLKDQDGKPPVAAPKDNDEYIAKMRAAKTPEERIQIKRSYVKT